MGTEDWVLKGTKLITNTKKQRLKIGQSGRPGAWDVERDMALDGGRRPLFECRGLGFEAREQQDQMS